MPAIGMPSGSPGTPRVVAVRARDDARTSGSSARGTPSSVAAARASQSSVCRSNSSVRDAFVTSVTCAAPPVSRQTRKLSTVPNASSPALGARAQRRRRCRAASAILVPEKYGIEHQAGLLADARLRAARPSARRSGRRCGGPARRSRCAAGLPVARSQTQRRLALVGDADRGDRRRATSARRAAPRRARRVTDAQISSGSCSTQPGFGKCCANSR